MSDHPLGSSPARPTACDAAADEGAEGRTVIANFGASVAVTRLAIDSVPVVGAVRAGRREQVPERGSETAADARAAPEPSSEPIDGSDVARAVPLRSLPLLVAGDRVRCEREAGGSLRVVELLPRRSVLERPDHRGRPKPLAANLTHLGIVSAAPPGIDTLLIDEFSVGARRAGIEPLVIVNKADRLSEEARRAVEALLAVYAAAAHPTLLVDAKSEAGLEPLRAWLGERPVGAEPCARTVALVGASGVGKSSIVQRLLPDREVRIGAISAATGLGSHTTSVTFLYELPEGGAVIDSPGVRRYSVAHLDPADVRAGYRDIAAIAERCRYRDCAHAAEPGCAVHEALETGALARWRHANFRKLLTG